MRNAITTKKHVTTYDGLTVITASCQDMHYRCRWVDCLNAEENHKRAACFFGIVHGWYHEKWTQGGAWHMGWITEECGVHVFVDNLA